MLGQYRLMLEPTCSDLMMAAEEMSEQGYRKMSVDQREKGRGFKVNKHLPHLKEIQLVPVKVKQKVLQWLDWMWAYQMASLIRERSKRKS